MKTLQEFINLHEKAYRLSSGTSTVIGGKVEQAFKSIVANTPLDSSTAKTLTAAWKSFIKTSGKKIIIDSVKKVIKNPVWISLASSDVWVADGKTTFRLKDDFTVNVGLPHDVNDASIAKKLKGARSSILGGSTVLDGAFDTGTPRITNIEVRDTLQLIVE